MIITNRKQLRTTVKKIADLEGHEQDLARARGLPERNTTAIDMELASLAEVLDDLRDQVADYERLDGS